MGGTAMMEKKFKQVCECENCGNEAEMTITCKLIPEEDATPKAKPAAPAKEKIKGHAVCSQCGGEADIWIDDIENLQKA
jgi:hypothetical protein